jgi:hypothetical protein
MTKMMKREDSKTMLSPEQFANLGGGEVAYLRTMRSEDVNRIFPGTPPIAPGMKIFALFAADGSPILISDSRDAALENAMEHDLVTVALH